MGFQGEKLETIPSQLYILMTRKSQKESHLNRHLDPVLVIYPARA